MKNFLLASLLISVINSCGIGGLPEEAQSGFVMPTKPHRDFIKMTKDLSSKIDEATQLKRSNVAGFLLAENVELLPELNTPEVVKDRLERLSKFYEVDMDYHEKVITEIDRFVNTRYGRAFVSVALEKSEHYFPIFEDYMWNENVPLELKYLSVIESGLRPKATSYVGAQGLWQFMPTTASMFDLKIDNNIDQRSDPWKSSEAAAKYLSYLHDKFGDWHLAIAAYNCGPGRVERDLKRTGATNFWEVMHALPKETQKYVPRYIAMVYAMNHASDHGIYPKSERIAKRFLIFSTTSKIDLVSLSLQLGLDSVAIINSNPQIKNRVLPKANVAWELRVPNQESVFENLQNVDNVMTYLIVDSNTNTNTNTL